MNDLILRARLIKAANEALLSPVILNDLSPRFIHGGQCPFIEANQSGIVSILLSKYNVQPQEAEDEVNVFIEKLAKNGLVS